MKQNDSELSYVLIAPKCPKCDNNKNMDYKDRLIGDMTLFRCRTCGARKTSPLKTVLPTVDPELKDAEE